MSPKKIFSKYVSLSMWGDVTHTLTETKGREKREREDGGEGVTLLIWIQISER